MQNNDFFRRLRYALNLKNELMLELFATTSHEVDLIKLLNYLKKEDEYGYTEMPDAFLSDFLDAFITFKRGKSDNPPPQFDPKKNKLNNNILLKKLRIALKLDEKGMLEVFTKGERTISPSELGAFFRKHDNRHYRDCGDQWMRAFLKGLA